MILWSIIASETGSHRTLASSVSFVVVELRWRRDGEERKSSGSDRATVRVETEVQASRVARVDWINDCIQEKPFRRGLFGFLLLIDASRSSGEHFKCVFVVVPF